MSKDFFLRIAAELFPIQADEAAEQAEAQACISAFGMTFSG